ncbi:MAG: DUF4338 domain-containing protein [Anaerolinea sp.]|nr:DUF4338 domain-containing protein [Anaerolinea sp.]
MDTRLRGYDTTSGKFKNCKDSAELESGLEEDTIASIIMRQHREQMSDTTPYLFWSQTIGPYESDLNQLLAILEKGTLGFLAKVETALNKLSCYPNAEEERLKYEAYLHVLRDLLRQEWRPEVRQGRLYLYPPASVEVTDGKDPVQQHKDAIRNSLDWERKAQFHKKSVQEFIAYVERERAFAGHAVSIRLLIADGKRLARQLHAIAQLDEAAQAGPLGEVIQPYLQLVTDKARCEYTGLLLQDVWRYFRYQWATPYNPTPGRQMFYLVRDANQPFHPIIGIAALGSSLVQLTARDDVIGWTPKAFEKRLFADDFDDDQAEKIGRMMLKTLDDVLADIATEGLVTVKELESPSLEIVQRLQEVEAQNRANRIELLQQKRESERQKNIPNQPPLDLDDVKERLLMSPEELSALAMKALYAAKRAKMLQRLLAAKMVAVSSEFVGTANSLRKLWQSDEGQKALKILIQENKKRKVGINMMDIIICGAVPPYNILMGGKLVAMLLAGPQTMSDYERKYTGYASKIASELKGEAVRREPRLVFLGTTSLYAMNSSQYNRIVIPTLINHGKEQIRYEKYGLTKGYGSVHFSEKTRQALERLLLHTKGARLINNRFGEGVNPKLRHASAGLTAIGLIAVDNFIRHRSQRIVYGVPLGRKAYAFLCGETEDPEYFFDASSPQKIDESMQHIAHYWAARWLSKRVRSAKFLELVASFDKNDYLLSNELQDDALVKQHVIKL